MPQRIVICLLVLAALCLSNAQAGTMQVYAVHSGPSLNTGPQNFAVTPLPNSDSFFDVFVKTDIEVNGMSLDMFLTGDPAIKLTSVIVQNPLNPSGGVNTRWSDFFNGTVAADGRSAHSADAFTLSNNNRGMNPANATTDLGYDIPAGAFHYARVNYHTAGFLQGVTFLNLGIGLGDIGTNPAPPPTTVVYLGVTPGGAQPEPAACSTENFDCPGATSQYADGMWFVPEPASFSLFGLAVLGLAGWVRRHC